MNYTVAICPKCNDVLSPAATSLRQKLEEKSTAALRSEENDMDVIREVRSCWKCADATNHCYFTLTLRFAPRLDQIHEVCSQVLGAKHYSTALTGLTIVDSMCLEFNRVMILGQAPEELELAECVDTLTRIFQVRRARH